MIVIGLDTHKRSHTSCRSMRRPTLPRSAPTTTATLAALFPQQRPRSGSLGGPRPSLRRSRAPPGSLDRRSRRDRAPGACRLSSTADTRSLSNSAANRSAASVPSSEAGIVNCPRAASVAARRHATRRQPTARFTPVFYGPARLTHRSMRRGAGRGQCPMRWITPTSSRPLRTSCTARAARRNANTFSVTSIRLSSRWSLTVLAQWNTASRIGS